MKHDELQSVYCSVARTWSVIGERWTILILREAFRGISRYDDLRQNLQIGRNVLSDRLKLLIDEGVLERIRYQDRPKRYEYKLTPRGEELYPVLMALMSWGDKHMLDEPPMQLIHDACGHEAKPRMACSHCGGPVEWRNLTAEYAAGAWLGGDVDGDPAAPRRVAA
jgi:DNA-binding HxlR family transcriptional regulator